MINLTIVVPAFNEENRIGSTLKDILEEFRGQQIIVVSDGSTDGTDELVCSFDGVELIRSELTGGKGSAIVKGLRSAKGDIIGFLDADGSFSPSQVRKLVEAVGAGADCVIASKWIGQGFSSVGETTMRKLTSRVWNLLVRVLTGLDISDTQAGAKFFKRKVFESIDCEFISKGFEFDVELLARIKKGGFSIVELHTPFKDVRDSTFRYGKTLGMFISLVRLFFSLM